MTDAALRRRLVAAAGRAGKPGAARAAPAVQAQGRAWSGLAVIAIFILLALFAPLIAPYDPDRDELERWCASRPRALHWFGTDELGRDVLAPRHLRRARLAAGRRDLGRDRAGDRRAARPARRAIAAARSTR